MLGCGPYQAAVALAAQGIPSYFADVADAGLWSPSGCGGTDGLGILVVVSDAIYVGLCSHQVVVALMAYASLLLLMLWLMQCSGRHCAVAVMMPWVCLMMLLLFQLLAPSC